MDVLRKEFPKVSFKGSFSMGWMDSRHMLIHFDFGRRLYEVLDEGDMVFSRVSSSGVQIVIGFSSCGRTFYFTGMGEFGRLTYSLFQ